MAESKKSTASKREQLVKDASAANKKVAPKKKTGDNASATTGSVVRNSSLEQKYLEKFQADKSKKETATKKATTTTTTKKATATSKPTAKEDVAVESNGKKNVRVGNVVVDKDMANSQTGIIQSDKEKQKSLAIAILSILLIIVLLLSGIFIFGSLNKKYVGIMKIEGVGAEWYLNDRRTSTFSVNDEIVSRKDCTITINMKLKKLLEQDLTVRVKYSATLAGEPFDEITMVLPTEAKFVQQGDEFVYENWSGAVGSTVVFATGFTVYDASGKINNNNFKITFTATIS